MVKKLLIVAISMILLTACSSTKPLEYKNDVALYTLNGKTTYESNYYDFLIRYDKGITIYSSVINLLNENSDAQERYGDKINELLNQEIQSMEEKFGETLNIVLLNAGFNSLDEFIDQQLRPSIALQLEMEEYATQNIDSIIKDFNLKDISLFSTDDEALSNTIIEELNSGVEPSKIDIEGKGKLAEMLVTKSLDTDSTPLNKRLAKDIPYGTPEKIYDEESNIYYIVLNHDTNFVDNISAVMGVLIEAENYSDIYTAKQFNDIGFKIFDQSIKKTFNELKPGYLD